MGSLANSTPASTFKDILHVANGGSGISATTHSPIYDGFGNPTGVKVGGGKVSIDFAGGQLSNGVFNSKMSAAPLVQSLTTDVVTIDMSSCASKLIRYTDSGASASITLSLPWPSIAPPVGNGIFAETRLFITGSADIAITLTSSEGSPIGAPINYVWNTNNMISFTIFAVRTSSSNGSTSFFYSETQHIPA